MIRHPIRSAVLLPCLTVLLAAPAFGAALRKSVDQRGDFVMFGNTLAHDCSANTPAPLVGTVGACGTSTTDSGADIFWRSESPTATTAEANSSITNANARSTAVLAIPAGATITYARLYWSATATAADNLVTLARSGTFSQDVTADQTWTLPAGSFGGPFYQGSADVTALVKLHGTGAYRLSGVTTQNPVNVNNEVIYAAWSMVVFYEDDNEPIRNLTLFDGFDAVANAAPSEGTISGFLVPSSGVISGRLGVIAYEGDVGNTGDQLLFDGVALSNATNPANNFFNSSRSEVGVAESRAGDLPRMSGAPGSMSGIDLDVVDISSRLSAGKTSAVVRATSTLDVYNLGAFVTSITTYKPSFITTQKSWNDVNGGVIQAGDVIEYVITTRNTGNDTAVDVVMTDALPAGITYVSGSIQIDGVGRTDQGGDDPAEYVAATRTLTARLGAGATATEGGTILPGAPELTIRFQVTVDPDIAGDVLNQAVISARGELGAPVETYLSDQGGAGGGQPTSFVVAPDTTIASGPSSPSNSASATFSFTSTAASATFECSFDGIDFSACASAPTFALPEGEQTLRVRALHLGVTDPSPATYTWTIDLTPPSEPVILLPVDGDVTSLSIISFQGLGEVDAIIEVRDALGVLCSALVQSDGTWACTSPQLADDVYVVEAVARDLAGNETFSSVTTGFTIDTTPPQPPVIELPTDGATTGAVRPSFSGLAEAASLVIVSLDGVELCRATASPLGAWACTSLVRLADGMVMVVAHATDGLGNESAASERTFSIDAFVPLAPVIDAPAEGSATNDVTPELRGTAEADVVVEIWKGASLLCQAIVDAQGAWRCDSESLLEGEHVVFARAISALGNDSDVSADRTFSIDLLPPTEPLISSPSSGAALSTLRPMFEGLGEPGASVRIEENGSLICVGLADFSGAFACVPAFDLEERAYVVIAIATDPAGNDSTASPTVNFTLDITPPPPPSINEPVDAAVVSVLRPEFRGTATAGVTVEVFAGVESICTAVADEDGAWVCTASDPFAEDEHTVQAVASDAAGNPSTDSSPVTFTVDRTAPDAPMISGPANGSVVRLEFPVFMGNAEPGSTVRVDHALLGTLCTALADDEGEWSCPSALALGETFHTVDAVSTDAAGNSSTPSAPSTFEVDLSSPEAPSISEPISSPPLADDRPRFAGLAEPFSTVVVTSGVSVVCTATTNELGAWSCTPETPLAQGAFVVVAVATDVAGNDSPASEPRGFSIDLTRPEAPVILAPVSGLTSAETQPTFSGTAEPGSTVTVTDGTREICSAIVDAEGAWECTATLTLDEGPHAFTASTEDAAGHLSDASETVTLTLDLTAPVAPIVLTPEAGKRLAVRTPAFTGTAEPGSNVRVELAGNLLCATGADATTGAWSCVSSESLADDDYTVTAFATDLHGNGPTPSLPRAFSIDTTEPDAPSISEPTAGLVSPDASLLIRGSAEPNSTIVVTSGTTTVCTATTTALGAWSCTPQLPFEQGDHVVVAIATDVAGNDSAESEPRGFSVDLTRPEAPVILAPVTGLTSAETQPTFSGTAEAGSTVTVTDGTREICSALVATDGTWDCTSSLALDEETYAFTATAEDAAGHVSDASEAVTLTLDLTAPEAPVIFTPAADAHVSTRTPTFSGTAEPGSAVRVELGGTLLCATSADATTGAWSCVSSESLADDDYTVTAIATDLYGNGPTPSLPRSFTIDLASPEVPAILEPVSGSTSRTGSPQIRGSAEPNSTIAVTSGATTVCTATTTALGAWSCTPLTPFADGGHVISAVATDLAGNGSSAARVLFFVDSLAPGIPTIEAPFDGSITGRHPTFSGTGEPGSTVSVFVDLSSTESCAAEADANGNWACIGSTALALGMRSAHAVAEDEAGNASNPSAPVSFTVASDVPPGPPIVLSPRNATSVGTTTPTIVGRAEPSSTVQVFVDGTLACSAVASIAGDFSCQVTSALAEGTHTLAATATNLFGTGLPSPATTFAVDTQLPLAPTLTRPTSGATTSPFPAFAGTAEANAVVSVFVDGALLSACDAEAESDGTWSCTPATALAVGSRSALAVAFDQAGNESPPSAATSFTVDANAPPSPPNILRPRMDAVLTTTRPTFSGTAEPGAGIQVFDHTTGALLCVSVAVSDGQWACVSITVLPTGAHEVVAEAITPTGTSERSAIRRFTIASGAVLAPVLMLPADGSLTDRWPAFSGAATPGVTVTVRVDGQVVCQAVADVSGAFRCSAGSALPVGPATAFATATNAGASSVPSNLVDFTVVLRPPSTPTLTQPNAGRTAENMPTFSGVAEPGSTVDVFVDGNAAPICSAVADALGAWTCTPDTALADGDRTITANATNVDGTGPSSPPLTLGVDTQAPAPPEILSPGESAIVGGQPTFSGTSEPSSAVSVFVDGSSTTACEATASGAGAWSCVAQSALSMGAHTARARATDDVGNVGALSPVRNFTVQLGTPPGAPTISLPVPGALLNTNRPTFGGRAEAGSSVSAFVEGASTAACTAQVDANGSWACVPQAALSEGAHSVRARAANAIGEGPFSSEVPFTIDTVAPTPPQLVEVKTTPETSSLPTFSGTAEPGSTVEVYVDGELACSAVVDADGHFECTATWPVGPGGHSVTVVATDAAGNRSSETLADFLMGRGGYFRGGGLGCSSTGGSGLSWLALFVVAALLSRRRQWASVVAASLVFATGAVKAQPIATFDLERIHLNAAGAEGLMIETADTLAPGSHRAGVSLHYQQSPLLYVDSAGEGAIVGSRLVAHVVGAYGVLPWLEASAQIPMLLLQSGEDLSARGVPEIQRSPSLGTGILQLRSSPWLERDGRPVDLGGGVALLLPFGSGGALTSDRSVGVATHVGVGRSFGALRLGGQLGFRYRPTTQLSPDRSIQLDEIGSTVTTGVVLSSRGPGLRWEVSGRVDSPLTRTAFAGELIGGVRYPLPSGLELHAMAGPGIGSAPGVPLFRTLIGISYAAAGPPRCAPGAPHEPSECPDLDADSDGVRNAVDVCVLEPGLPELGGCPDADGDGVADREDRCPTVAGLSVHQGCLPPDSDGDGLTDEVDACPNEAGIELLNGCPVRDGDGDGLPDHEDACPSEAGLTELKGCPARDGDADGISDHLDACPTAPGPLETKGCPDPDQDGDGVPDRVDNCRTEAGPADNQGCPATKKQLVVITKEKLDIKQKVFFATGKANVLPKSFALLDQVAQILREHPEIETIRIEGHTDSVGVREKNVRLSQSRAEAVRDYLVKKGVETGRLTAVGYGPDRPADVNDTAEGRENNRRVEFRIGAADDELMTPLVPSP